MDKVSFDRRFVWCLIGCFSFSLPRFTPKSAKEHRGSRESEGDVQGQKFKSPHNSLNAFKEISIIAKYCCCYCRLYSWNASEMGRTIVDICNICFSGLLRIPRKQTFKKKFADRISSKGR